MLGKVRRNGVHCLPCSSACSATQKHMNSSNSGGFIELNVQSHPSQRSWVRLSLWSSGPAALPELYPVTALAKMDQKVLSRTTNDIPITQKIPKLVALSKVQDKDQIHSIFIENVTMSLIFFFLTFGLLKKKDSVILYMYIICIEYIPVTHAQNCSSSHPVAVS